MNRWEAGTGGALAEKLNYVRGYHNHHTPRSKADTRVTPMAEILTLESLQQRLTDLGFASSVMEVVEDVDQWLNQTQTRFSARFARDLYPLMKLVVTYFVADAFSQNAPVLTIVADQDKTCYDSQAIIFARYRKGFGDSRTSEEAPAQIFEGNEIDELAAYLAVVWCLGWSVLICGKDGALTVWLDFDEKVWVKGESQRAEELQGELKRAYESYSRNDKEVF
jgi:hypothetical protein